MKVGDLVKWIGRDGKAEFGTSADVYNWTGLVLQIDKDPRDRMFHMLGSSGNIQHYTFRGWKVIKCK